MLVSVAVRIAIPWARAAAASWAESGRTTSTGAPMTGVKRMLATAGLGAGAASATAGGAFAPAGGGAVDLATAAVAAGCGGAGAVSGCAATGAGSGTSGISTIVSSLAEDWKPTGGTG